MFDALFPAGEGRLRETPLADVPQDWLVDARNAAPDAQKAADAAQKMGYKNVTSLIGGYKALVAANWPMKK